MRFISIDSSLSNTGVAVGQIKNLDHIDIEYIKLHKTKKSKSKQIRASSDVISRCRSTWEFLSDIIKEHDPHFIFIETPSGSQNASGMKSYGVTCQLIACLEPRAMEVTPMEVKVATVGHQKASKEEMIEWAYKRYSDLQWTFHNGKLKNDNEHMADAICVAYAAIATTDFIRVFEILNK